VSLRIGVLGASRIAEQAIVGPAAELGHRLVAVAARSRSRAEEFAEKYGVERVLDGYQDVIDDAQVDVVYNPLANSLHAPWNLAAIAAGKPVLSEKPFARDASEARTVAEAAAAAGVSVLEGFHYFFHPVTQRAFELAADGTIGAITHVEVRMAMPPPGDDDPRWSLELAGGALMDLGCYGLHVMRSLGQLAMPGVEGHPSITRAHAEQRTPGVDARAESLAGGGRGGHDAPDDGRGSEGKRPSAKSTELVEKEQERIGLALHQSLGSHRSLLLDIASRDLRRPQAA